MDIQISKHKMSLLIQKAAEMGAKLALAQTGRIKPYLKKSEAFSLYGRKNIERWIDEGLITIRKDGNHSAQWRICRIELDAVAKSGLLLKYL